MSEPLVKTPAIFGENGNFVLERELGSGGMGGVYMGRDKMLDRPVAVKVMQKELGADAEFVEKFKKEAQAAARLIHPNIAQIYSYGIHDGMPYIAMELASGGSLYSVMNANPGKCDIPRVLKICQQVAQALQCATDQGLVHGDVKPENILLDANGNAKLVDFGLAGMQKDTSEIWGTPYYISPEKVKKEVVDFRADMYSLGGTLYHALTGIAPFEGADMVEVVKKRFDGPPMLPSSIRPEITPAIDTLVMTMLALDKSARYPSFEALLQAFKDVLTSGLTQKIQSPVGAQKPAASGATAKPGAGGRMVRRPGMRRPLKKLKPITEDTEDEEAPADSKKRRKAKTAEEEDEEESGGGIGAKVALAIVGGLAVIGAVIGFLVWYQIHDKEVREREKQEMISSNIAKARDAIAGNKAATEKFETEFIEFAKAATVECEGFTRKLQELIPDYASEMQPPPTEELLKAIALTNVVVEATNTVAAAETPTNAVSAVTNAAPSSASAPAKGGKKKLTLQAEAEMYGIPYPEDFDPSSPEGEDFLKQLKEARAAAAAKSAENAEGDSGEKPSEAAPTEPVKEKAPPPAVLTDMKDLWERTYSCQASVINIIVASKKVYQECAKADELKGDDEATMNALAELSNTTKELHESIKASKDVENVKKGISYIKSKGGSAVKQTVKRLAREKQEKDLAELKAKQAEEERLRKEKAEADKKALIEKECQEIAAKFDSIAAQGCFRQLDWKSAKRQLEDVANYFKSTEGGLAYKEQLRKVEAMQKVQDIFISQLSGHVFKSNKLKASKVVSVDAKDICILRTDNKQKQKIMWQKFYKDYPGNFNEIINTYIVNGRKHPKLKLNLKDWSNAMIGAALTMKLVCAEVNGATEKSAMLAKEVYKQYPDYQKFVKECFPEIDFESMPEEE